MIWHISMFMPRDGEEVFVCMHTEYGFTTESPRVDTLHNV